ncbi:transmembrane protein 81 [Hypanus sabinus]|uniref:transmembrane protein 81 n=1 Tax=Hypanus sabinus TaxID=79690 RepID=UPI0028C42D45|nr:transmembrane protein 81 [Hypanus sabinus]
MPHPHAALAFFLIFSPSLSLLANSQRDVSTLPPGLENITITGLLLVSANPCSKSCGLGWRSEYYCRVNQTGTTNDCVLKNAICLISQDCGLISKTITVGAPLNISCLDETIEALGSSDFVFVWKISKGIVTTDKTLFRLYPSRNLTVPWMINIKEIKEKNAGTYMCQVQNNKTMQVVKRVLIAVRVIPPDLVQLNYLKVLSPEQQNELQILEGKPVTGKQRRSFWDNVKDLFKSANMVFRVTVTGVTIGGLLGIVLVILLICMSKKK